MTLLESTCPTWCSSRRSCKKTSFQTPSSQWIWSGWPMMSSRTHWWPDRMEVWYRIGCCLSGCELRTISLVSDAMRICMSIRIHSITWQQTARGGWGILVMMISDLEAIPTTHFQSSIHRHAQANAVPMNQTRIHSGLQVKDFILFWPLHNGVVLVTVWWSEKVIYSTQGLWWDDNY